MAETVERLVATLEADIRNFSKGMTDAQRMFDQRASQIERRQSALMRKLQSGFSLRGLQNTILGGAALLGVQRFVSTVAAAAGKLQDTADALGVSTDALQTWGILAGRAGVDQDQLNRALGQFSQKLGEAQLKGGPFAKFLSGIGVGTQGSAEEVFNRLADAIKNTSDQQQRAAIVAEAFGNRAVRLTPILQQGSEALKAQGAEFARTGAIMTKDSIAKIDELGDKWEDLKRRLVSVGGNALAQLAPDVSALIDDISSPAFQSGLKAFVNAMVGVAHALVQMAPHLPAFAAALVGLRAMGGVGAAIGGLAGLGYEAYRRQTGQIADSPEKLAKDLANAQARAARREPGAAEQVAQLQAQLRHAQAAAAGIPFAGAGTPIAPAGGIDRTGALGGDEEEAKRRAAEFKLTLEGIAKLDEEIAKRTEQAIAMGDRSISVRAHEAATKFVDEKAALASIGEFTTEADELWDDYYQRQAEKAQDLHDVMKENIGDALLNLGEAALEGGDAFERAIRQMIIQATLLAIKLNVLKPLLDWAFGGTAGGGILGGLLEARASGGPVEAGRPYIVGEKRPELFVPKTSGTIIPQIPQAMAGQRNAPIVLHMPIDARGAQQGVAEQIAAVAPKIVEAAVRQVSLNFKPMLLKTQRNQL